MSGFKINTNQDLQGLFKNAEKAAVLDDEPTQVKAPTPETSENTEDTSPTENKEDNEHTSNTGNNVDIAQENSENVEPEEETLIATKPDEESAPLFIGKNKLNYEPFEPIMSNEDNARTVASEDSVISTTEDMTHADNSELVKPEIVGLGSIISKPTVKKIITVSNSVSSLDDDSLDFVSCLITKKNYPGEIVDLIFNIVNSSEKNVNDVRALFSVLEKNDRVERVFELLEFNIDDLISIGEIVTLITGEEVNGSDQKAVSRELERAIQSLSVNFEKVLSDNKDTVSDIINVL